MNFIVSSIIDTYINSKDNPAWTKFTYKTIKNNPFCLELIPEYTQIDNLHHWWQVNNKMVRCLEILPCGREGPCYFANQIPQLWMTYSQENSSHSIDLVCPTVQFQLQQQDYSYLTKAITIRFRLLPVGAARVQLIKESRERVDAIIMYKTIILIHLVCCPLVKLPSGEFHMISLMIVQHFVR